MKHLYEEKVTTEKNLQLARNELNMRDIYIKQLSHNHCTDSDLSNVESLNTIKGLKGTAHIDVLYKLLTNYKSDYRLYKQP